MCLCRTTKWQGSSRDAYNAALTNTNVTVSAKTSLVRTKILIHFLAKLIAILNSYPHSMSLMARLKWSAYLRGGFTALWDHDRHIDTCGTHQLGVISLEFYP